MTSSHSGQGDFWVDPNASDMGRASSPARGVHVKILGPASPLPPQLNLSVKKHLPDGLWQPLFGSVQNRDSDTAPVAGCFAILDGARVRNLAQMLNGAEFENICLFTGAAKDDLGDVAPWIIRLQEESNFTRRLFTQSDAPWDLWDANPGIFIRSTASIQELWRHYRKFTRLCDDNGKWYYFRFWEPRIFAAAILNDEELKIKYSQIIRAGDSVVLRNATHWLAVSGDQISERRGVPQISRSEFDRIVFSVMISDATDQLYREHGIRAQNGELTDALFASSRFDLDDKDRIDFIRAALLISAAGGDIEAEINRDWQDHPYSDRHMVQELLSVGLAIKSEKGNVS